MRPFSCILACILLIGCHDAPRNNPFDPALTPSVALLSVHVDEQEGTATLTWTRYTGEMAFDAYKVHRRVAGMAEPDTIFPITSVSDTLFVDDTIAPDTEYVYQVVVRNAEGFEHPGNEYPSRTFGLHGVELVSVEPDDRMGEARIVWRRYDGPDFELYRIERFDLETLTWEERRSVPSVGDTTFVDGDLRPEVRYRYRLVVRASGQVLASGEQEAECALPSVEFQNVEFDSRTATASLSWSRYDGPRFKSYEVRRRTQDLADQLVLDWEDIEQTSFVDRSLDGNTEYFYRVVVEDSTGVRSESEERSGGFHRFIEEYPLGFAPYGMVIDRNDRAYVGKRRGTSQLVVQYDLSFQEGVTAYLPGVILKEGKVDLSPDGRGNVYAAIDLQGGGVRVFKVAGGNSVWIKDIPMEGSRLGGIGAIGEDHLLVAGSESRDSVFVFDAEGQKLSRFSVYSGGDISAMEVWEDMMGVIVTGQGRIWAAMLGESDGIYGLLGGAPTQLGEGIGLGDGQLLFPVNMVKGDSDRLFVVNGGAERIEVFKGEEYLTRFGGTGNGPGEFLFREREISLGDVALDSAGNVYVADPGNRRIQKFEP